MSNCSKWSSERHADEFWKIKGGRVDAGSIAALIVLVYYLVID